MAGSLRQLPSMRVLIVEDDVKMASLLVTGLREEGFDPDVAHAGERGLSMATEQPYDAVVLDRMLPGIDGLTLCRRLRQQGNPVPVLMLTALGETADLVTGLEAGADDYLPKPFAFEELVARVHALGRRAPAGPPLLVRHDLTLDRARRRATRAARELPLTLKELGVLEVLLAADGAVVSAEELLERVWDENADPFTRTVTVTLTRLRRKLGKPEMIETVVGAGYRMR